MKAAHLASTGAAALLLGFGGASAAPTAEACWTVHAKVILTNGTPSLRVYPQGSSRIYGVHGRGGEAEFDLSKELPFTLARIPLDAYWEQEVTGDITVCPLTARRPGFMQSVVITGARNVVVAATGA